jgi:ribonucleotide reductase beta subunit family protein with ferritin-like domain
MIYIAIKTCTVNLYFTKNAWLQEEINYYKDTNNYPHLTDWIKQ